MATGKFKCPKCDRSFGMAAHLARHMNALHGRKKRAATGRRKGPKARAKGLSRARKVKRVATRRGVRAALVGGEAAQLVSSMQAYHRDLLTRRESIEAEILAIDRAIDAMGAGRAPATVRARRGRPGGRLARAGSLKSYIVKVLRQRSAAMSHREISSRILRAGYKSKAKDLTKAVSNTLPQLKQVKKVGFGMYKI